MPSNSADFSLVSSVDNTVVAVLLTVALAFLFFMVVGLLVFSLVAFMGSAVVDFAVLEFRSIVEILSLPFSFSSSLSAMQEKRTTLYQSGQYSTNTPSLVTPLPSLLDTIFFHFLQIHQKKLSLCHPASWIC